MKARLLTICAMALISLAASNQALGAVSFGFDPTGGGGAGAFAVNNAVTFDWAPDNALAVGGNTAVENYLTGTGPTTFTTFAQTRLSSMGLSTGGQAFLPFGWEYTFVTRINEMVTGVSPGAVAGDGTAYFGMAPGDNYIEIYAQQVFTGPPPVPVAGTLPNNPLEGTGYNDGTLILAASVASILSGSNFTTTPITGNLDNFVNNDYPGLTSLTGTGSIKLDAEVNYVDANYFPDLMPAASLTLLMDFPTNLVIPFNEVDPAKRFLTTTTTTAVGAASVLAGAGAPGDAVTGIGSINAAPTSAGGGPSVQEQFDSSASFEVVPEPAAVVIWGALLIPGIGLAARRRLRRRNDR